MRHEDWELEHTHQRQSGEADELVPQSPAVPGKRPLTMSRLPQPARLSATQVAAQQQQQQQQQHTGPAARPRRKEQTALTTQWMNVVMRPDLHAAPMQHDNAGAMVHELAARGASDRSSTLPYADPIQRPSGQDHDISSEADTTKEQPSFDEKTTVLARINELLAARPARQADGGAEHTHIRLEDELLVAEVTLDNCERSYRFEAPVAKLLFDNLETALDPKHGRGQVYIRCKNDESCVTWKIRDNDGAGWRTVRDDPAFVIDLAPDAGAVTTLRELLGGWGGD